MAALHAALALEFCCPEHPLRMNYGTFYAPFRMNKREDKIAEKVSSHRTLPWPSAFVCHRPVVSFGPIAISSRIANSDYGPNPGGTAAPAI